MYYTDSMVLMSLSLIAHLYPPKQTKVIQEETFRPSIGISKESMFKIASVRLLFFKLFLQIYRILFFKAEILFLCYYIWLFIFIMQHS